MLLFIYIQPYSKKSNTPFIYIYIYIYVCKGYLLLSSKYSDGNNNDMWKYQNTLITSLYMGAFVGMSTTSRLSKNYISFIAAALFASLVNIAFMGFFNYGM